jgi:hypothetical protein
MNARLAALAARTPRPVYVRDPRPAVELAAPGRPGHLITVVPYAVDRLITAASRPPAPFGRPVVRTLVERLRRRDIEHQAVPDAR